MEELWISDRKCTIALEHLGVSGREMVPMGSYEIVMVEF
jgi:hypothetical protein